MNEFLTNRTRVSELQQRIKKVMDERGADAIILTSPENVYYTSASLIMTQRSIPDRLAVCIFTRSGDNVDAEMVVCNIELSLVKLQSWIESIHSYVEFETSPIELAASVLKQKGVNTGRVLIETDHLVASFVDELTTCLPAIEIDSCDRDLACMRMIKTDAEINWLTAIGRKTETAISSAFALTRDGDAVSRLAETMKSNMLRLGVGEVEFCALGVGSAKSAIPHAEPDDEPIRNGDMIRVDIGGLWDGYYSDVARMMVLGEPTSQIKECYETLVRVQRKVISEMKPGAIASDLFNLCVDQFAQAGHKFALPHIGHSLGIGLHEFPMISPHHNERLAENMVICIEPFMLEPGIGGFHIEDLVLVTATGPQILTTTMTSDQLMIVDE